MRPIQNGFVVSAIVSSAGFGLVNYFYIRYPDGSPDMRFFWATFSGIILAVVISYLTEYYTAVNPVSATIQVPAHLVVLLRALL